MTHGARRAVRASPAPLPWPFHRRSPEEAVGGPSQYQQREMESGELDRLMPGDRVRSKDYGDGEVAISNELMLEIHWDDPRYEGRRSLQHQPSFARHLKRL